MGTRLEKRKSVALDNVEQTYSKERRMYSYAP